MPSSLSDDDLDKLVYGPTGKRPDPKQESPGDFEKFVTGFGQGVANPIEAPLKWAGRGDLIPQFAKDLEEKNKQGSFWGGAGEAIGTGLGAAGLAGAATMALPEEIGAGIAALPWAVRALLGIGGGSLGSLAARYPETNKEMYAQMALGGAAGGAGQIARGLGLTKGVEGLGASVSRPAVDPALVTAARTAAGNARRASLEAQFAAAAAARETNPAIARVMQERATLLAQRAGQAQAAAKAAGEAASRRPWGVYENIHRNYPIVANALFHPLRTLGHVAGQAALHIPPASAGSSTGVMMKDE